MFAAMALAAFAAAGVLRRRGVLSRRAFEPPRREVHALSAVAWLALGLVVYFGFLLGPRIALSAAGIAASGPTLRDEAVGMTGMYLGALLALAIAWPLVGPRLVRGGLRLNLWDLPRGAGTLLVALPILWIVSKASFLLAGWIASRTGAPAPDALGHVTLTAIIDQPHDHWWWLVIAGVVVGAPVVEEIVWRASVQSALRRAPGLGRWGGGWGAIALASLLFTAMHIGDAAWHTLPTIFVLALCLGVAFERTGRLGVAIAMHACFNALQLAIAIAQSGGASP